MEYGVTSPRYSAVGTDSMYSEGEGRIRFNSVENLSSMEYRYSAVETD